MDAFLAGFAGRYQLLHNDYQVAIEKLAIDRTVHHGVGSETP